MTKEDLDTMRDVLLGVSMALITSTRADPENVSTALRLFAQAHTDGSEAHRTLGEIASGVQLFGERIKQQPTKPS